MNEATAPASAPETIGPKEIGVQMAALREQFNLSQQEVSERLHIRPRYVSAIEEGRYELMPGKVYARGYVQTYAEFLGMNPEQVVAQCFAGEAPANAQPIPPIAAARYTSPAARVNMASSSSPWRGYAVMGAVVLVLVLIISQFMGHDSEPEKTETTVTPVPEAMLATVRTMVMPLPSNYTCLTSDDAMLECFNADETSRMMGRLDIDGFRYGGDIDVSSLAVVPAENTEETPATKEPTTEENPDSPPVAMAPDITKLDEEQKNEPGPPHD